MNKQGAKEYAILRKHELKTLNPDISDVAIDNKIIDELRVQFNYLVLTNCGKYVILYFSDSGVPVLANTINEGDMNV